MGTIIRSQAWFASWDGTMTTQEDWRLRNVIRSVTFISRDSSFPWYIGASHRYINLRRKEIKEESTKPTTSVREFTSNNLSIQYTIQDKLCFSMGLCSSSTRSLPLHITKQFIHIPPRLCTMTVWSNFPENLLLPEPFLNYQILLLQSRFLEIRQGTIVNLHRMTWLDFPLTHN